MSAEDDAQQDARHALHEASADLEALRTQAGVTIGDTKPEDEPIKNAWAVALERFRAACLKYVETMTQ